MKLPWWMKLDYRYLKAMYGLCAIEFPLTVATLALFGIADPNTYRTGLWTEGARHGWNSSPIKILYSYANYKPVEPPAPWNQFITDFNVVIVVLSMFILLAKTVMYIVHFFPPFFSVIVHACLATLYAVSISQQAGPDYLDPKHPSKHPWYLTRGCGDPVRPELQGYCKQAKASFGITIVMCSLFFVHFLVALFQAIPSKSQKESRAQDVLEEKTMSEYEAKRYDFEMDRMSQAPGSPMFSPMTPRTMAFNTLDGTLGAKRQTNKDLPLRHHIAMGDETYKGGNQYA